MILIAVFISLQIVDGCITYYGIAHKEIGEGALGTLFFIKTLGLVWGLVAAKGIAVLMGLALYKIYKEHPRIIFRLACAGTLLYATIVTGLDCLEWINAFYGANNSFFI